MEFGFRYFHVEPQFLPAAKLAFSIAGLTMASVLPLGIFSSVLVALERFDILSGVTIIGETLKAALIVIFLKMGHGLVAIALIALFISVSEYLVMAVFAKKLYPPLRISLRLVNRDTLSGLFGFGIYRFLWIVANQLIFYSDSVVIGIFLSTGHITYFAIAGTLINYGRNVVSLLTDTFYPAATRMDAKQDLKGLRELLIVGTRISLLISLPLCLGLVFLGKQFISLWMGPEYSVSWIYLAVLTIPQFTGMPQNVSALILAGMAKHKFLAYLILAEGLVNLILSIILIRKDGFDWGSLGNGHSGCDLYGDRHSVVHAKSVEDERERVFFAGFHATADRGLARSRAWLCIPASCGNALLAGFHGRSGGFLRRRWSNGLFPLFGFRASGHGGREGQESFSKGARGS